jgi:signal transduction histidine kinase
MDGEWAAVACGELGGFLDNQKDPSTHVRLADFIRQNEHAIVDKWIEFARTRSPASEGMSKLALQDHIHDILRFISADLESAQTATEQIDKSHGLADKDGPLRQSAAEIHAALRLADGFEIDQMVSEYRALRASVIKEWMSHAKLVSTDIEDLTRFNEAIDQAVAESVAHYTKTINNSRNLFLGILAHDLRNPLSASSMAARWMEQSGWTDPAKQAKVVSELIKSTDRATRILDDLLDLTRSSFGTEIPVSKSRTDLAALSETIADELRSAHDARRIEVTYEGDPNGCWDAGRLGQALSNLVGNAIQYGDASEPIVVMIAGKDPAFVEVSVHNFGAPISSDVQKTVFESWTRGRGESPGRHLHLGLGLYIARLTAEAHGGEIAVTSTEQAGTTFTFRLPRA